MSEESLNTINGQFENTSFVQAQQDAFSSFMAIPVAKLDADQYLVSDLDGVTESLFGSGNMNFLMMQTGQTNESMQAAGLLDMVGGNDMYAASLPILAGGSSGLSSSYNENAGFVSMRGGDNADMSLPASEGTGISNALGTIGSASAASTASAAATSLAQSDFSSSQTPTGVPTNGTNGNNGLDGTGGPGDTINNIVNNATTNVTELVDNTVTNLFDTINNTTNNVTELVDNTVTNLFDTINNTTNNVTELVDNTITNLGDVINNTTNNVTEIVTEVTDIIETIITNIFNTINGGDGIGPIGIDLSATLDDLTNLNLDIISGDQIFNVINEIIDLSPILTPVGDLSAGLDLGIILNPFQYDNDPDDYDVQLLTDLDVLGLPLLSALDGLDIPLDPVEALIGDVDIDLGLASNLINDLLGGDSNDTDLGVNLGGVLDDLPIVSDLGVLEMLGDLPILSDVGLDNVLGNLPLVSGAENILLNPVEDLLGDIDLNIVPNLDLFNTANIDNASGDTDIVIPLDINLLGSNLLGDSLNITLDPVEAILGDIDLDVTAAANLLGNAADGLIDNLAGGSGQDTILSQIGDGLQDLGLSLLPTSNSDDTDVALDLGAGIFDNTLIDNAGGLLLDPVEDLLGDIDLGVAPNLDLFNTSNIDNNAGDTDIVIPLDINIAGHNILGDTIAIDLDPLEAITGDIDLDLTLATDLLGNTADNLLDSLSGGTGQETLLSEIGSSLSHVVSNLIPDTGDGNLIPSIGLDDIGGDLTNGLPELDLDLVDSLLGEADITEPLTSILSDDPVSAITGALDDLTGSLDVLDSLLGGSDTAPADLVDSLFGSIESTITGALDILDSSAPAGGLLSFDGLLANDNDGGGIGMWTESILPDAGDALGSGLGLDITSILPDPIINMPVIPVTAPPVIGDVLGGLGLGGGGGRHFGGLFG